MSETYPMHQDKFTYRGTEAGSSRHSHTGCATLAGKTVVQLSAVDAARRKPCGNCCRSERNHA